MRLNCSGYGQGYHSQIVALQIQESVTQISSAIGNTLYGLKAKTAGTYRQGDVRASVMIVKALKRCYKGLNEELAGKLSSSKEISKANPHCSEYFLIL